MLAAPEGETGGAAPSEKGTETGLCQPFEMYVSELAAPPPRRRGLKPESHEGLARNAALAAPPPRRRGLKPAGCNQDPDPGARWRRRPLGEGD